MFQCFVLTKATSVAVNLLTVFAPLCPLARVAVYMSLKVYFLLYRNSTCVACVATLSPFSSPMPVENCLCCKLIFAFGANELLGRPMCGTSIKLHRYIDFRLPPHTHPHTHTHTHMFVSTYN